MNYIRMIWNILFLILSSVSFAQVNHFNVIYSDMSDSMERFVLGEALVLSAKEDNSQNIAEKLIDILNTEYGKQWNVIYGTKTEFFGVTFMKNTTLEFKFNTTNFLIGRQQTIATDLISLIKNARNSTVQEIYKNDANKFNKIVLAAKKLLNVDFDKCKQSNVNSYNDGCFHEYSISLSNEILQQKIFDQKNYVLDTNIGIKNNFQSNSKIVGISYENYQFTLGDIVFDIALISANSMK